jgi:hypothetical protein
MNCRYLANDGNPKNGGSDGRTAGIVRSDGEKGIGEVAEFRYDDQEKSVSAIVKITDDRMKEAIRSGRPPLEIAIVRRE